MSVGTYDRRDQSLSGWDQMCALEQMRERQACSAMAGWLGQLARWDICAMLAYDHESLFTRWSSRTLPWTDRNPPLAEEHVRLWLMRCERLLGRSLQAVFTQEYHRSGYPHWHGLLATEGISSDDRVLVAQEWLATHGYAEVAVLQPPRRIEHGRNRATPCDAVWPSTASDYCTKYLWKPEGTLLFHGFENEVLQNQFRQILGNLLWGTIGSADDDVRYQRETGKRITHRQRAAVGARRPPHAPEILNPHLPDTAAPQSL